MACFTNRYAFRGLDGPRVKSSLYIILLLFLVFGFVNCRKIEPSQRSRILELRQLSKKEVKSKSMQGGLFFGVGGFSSSEKQELYINTIVKTESGFQYFKIPLSKSAFAS